MLRRVSPSDGSASPPRPASCPHSTSCPLYPQFTMESFLRCWRTSYCDADYARFVRKHPKYVFELVTYYKPKVFGQHYRLIAKGGFRTENRPALTGKTRHQPPRLGKSGFPSSSR